MQDEAVFEWLKPYLLLVMPPSSKLAVGYRQSATANFYLAYSPAGRRWFVLPRKSGCWCLQLTLADDRSLSASLGLQQRPDDWEFSNQLMPASFDLIRLLLADCYNDFAIRNFESMYQPRMDRLHSLVKSVYPQNTPPLEQLLALQFCQHFADRVAGFNGVTNATMRRLEGILETAWINRTGESPN